MLGNFFAHYDYKNLNYINQMVYGHPDNLSIKWSCYASGFKVICYLSLATRTEYVVGREGKQLNPY